jgi:hypothetical protein
MTSGVTFVSQNKKPVKIGSLLGSLLGRKRRGCVLTLHSVMLSFVVLTIHLPTPHRCSVLHMGTSPLLYQRDQPLLTDDVVR